MDKKALISFEVKSNERVYTLLIPVGAPLGEAYDAVFTMLNELLAESQKAVESAQNKQTQGVSDV